MAILATVLETTQHTMIPQVPAVMEVEELEQEVEVELVQVPAQAQDLDQDQDLDPEVAVIIPHIPLITQVVQK